MVSHLSEVARTALNLKSDIDAGRPREALEAAARQLSELAAGNPPATLAYGRDCRRDANEKKPSFKSRAARAMDGSSAREAARANPAERTSKQTCR